MKTERRHDLETNELAIRLAHWIEKIKPYTGALVGGLVVLCGVGVVSSFWSSQAAAKRQAAWDEFIIAQDTTDPELAGLRRVADKEEYAGTPMWEWAYVTWADRQVLLASGEYLVDRKSSQDRLRQVVGIYEELAEGVADPVIQNRARFGLARVYQLQDKLEEAREQYSLVQGDLEPTAAYREEQLALPKVQEAYTWLASAELPRRNFGEGNKGAGARPNFNATLPDATPPESSPQSSLPDARTLEEILGTAGEEAGGEKRYPTESAENNSAEGDAAKKSAEESKADPQASEKVEEDAEQPAAGVEEDAKADADAAEK